MSLIMMMLASSSAFSEEIEAVEVYLAAFGANLNLNDREKKNLTWAIDQMINKKQEALEYSKEKLAQLNQRPETCKIYYKIRNGPWICTRLIAVDILLINNVGVLKFNYGAVVFDWIQRKTLDSVDVTKINEIEYFKQ